VQFEDILNCIVEKRLQWMEMHSGDAVENAAVTVVDPSGDYSTYQRLNVLDRAILFSTLDLSARNSLLKCVLCAVLMSD